MSVNALPLAPASDRAGTLVEPLDLPFSAHAHATRSLPSEWTAPQCLRSSWRFSAISKHLYEDLSHMISVTSSSVTYWVSSTVLFSSSDSTASIGFASCAFQRLKSGRPLNATVMEKRTHTPFFQPLPPRRLFYSTAHLCPKDRRSAPSQVELHESFLKRSESSWSEAECLCVCTSSGKLV